jgi:hypothetical protein
MQLTPLVEATLRRAASDWTALQRGLHPLRAIEASIMEMSGHRIDDILRCMEASAKLLERLANDEGKPKAYARPPGKLWNLEMLLTNGTTNEQTA